MPDLVLGAQRIRYDDHGGTGPTVVFCHSYAMDGSMFEPQLTAFRRRYRCITWDQRGHGASRASESFTFWDSARDVLALLDHLKVRRAVLVGTSQGGFVSLRAALLAPDRIAGIVVLGSSAQAESPSKRASFKLLRTALMAMRATGMPQLPLNVMSDICFGSGFENSAWIAKWKLWPTDQLKLAFEALIDRDDILPRLPGIKVPALVMHGSADRAYEPDIARAIAAGVANCKGFHVVDGGAHFLSLTNPRPVNAALENFLQVIGDLH